MTVLDQEVEVASRAIWDQYAGDCNSDCRWGQMCHCETMSREWAVAAIEAIAKLKSERGKELAQLAVSDSSLTPTEKP